MGDEVRNQLPNSNTTEVEPMALDLNALRARRDRILELAERRGARNVRLFGSIARGDSSVDSDVDFLVDMDAGRSLLDMGGLLVDLETLLEQRVDVVTEAGLRPRIREHALREAIPL